jgi:EpsI family protein
VLTANGANLHRWWIPIATIAALFLVLLFIFPFNSGDSSINAPLGPTLWAIWTGTGTDTDQDHSYCLLVPLMVGYLLWEKRKDLARTPAQGTNSALVWIVLGLVCFWLGARAGKQYMGFIGIQLLLFGVISWFWGGAMFRKLLFTWAILFFAWPLPFLDTAVAFPLRMIVSTTAHHVLSLIGISNLQSGTALLSAPTANLETGAKFQIDVADPCSGLHSLMPFLMFSSFYCYFFLPKTWQKWTVFLSTFVFAIAGNIFRIVMLVIGCLLWGSTFAIGTNDEPSTYHEACGFAVFVVGLGLECLFGYLLILANHRLSKAQPRAMAPEPSRAAKPENSPTAIPAWRSATVFGVAVAMLVIFLVTPPVFLPTEAGVVMDLPDQVKLTSIDGGDFFGSPAEVSDTEHRLLPKDTEYARKNYDDFDGHQIYFSIVLSGLQQYTIHPPEVCLVAQGWTIAGQEDVPVELDSGHHLVVRNLSLQRNVPDHEHQPHLVKAYYMYWYVADNLTTPSHLERNLMSSWDRIVHNRDHRWAYVIAMSPITETLYPDGMNPSQTRDMLTAFIRQIVPTFQKSEIPRYTAKR